MIKVHLCANKDGLSHGVSINTPVLKYFPACITESEKLWKSIAQVWGIKTIPDIEPALAPLLWSATKAIVTKWEEYSTVTYLMREHHRSKLIDQASRALIKDSIKTP